MNLRLESSTGKRLSSVFLGRMVPEFLRVKTQGDETTSLIISATETTLGAVNPVLFPDIDPNSAAWTGPLLEFSPF